MHSFSQLSLSSSHKLDAMPISPPKPVVTSWDVFDTLIARFTSNPHAVFQSVETNQNVVGYVGRRVDAQAALDRRGAPYVLNDIYYQMVADGMPTAEARLLLRAELAAEREQLFPIRRNVARVDPLDLIITDMYLSPEMISGILFETCNLYTHRPIIRSNWGKSTGTIWPLVLSAYVIRRHVGDNPHGDFAMPSRFHIACELVEDTQFTPWEMKLNALGLGQLALIQREVRLRTTPPDAIPFHEAVVGPYLTILACYAIYLVQRFGTDGEFAFLSRSADDLCRVFVSMFPDIPARSLDISRRLANDENMAAVFAHGITPATVVVDMVGTGRSFFRFAEKNSNPGRAFILLMFLELLLTGAERNKAEQRQSAGRFMHVLRFQDGQQGHWYLEHLLQAHYPPVASVGVDLRSGGIVRTMGAPELNRIEADLVAWKSAAVTEFVRATRQRGLTDPGAAPVIAAMENAVRVITSDKKIVEPFVSFAARERMDRA
jgi:hypothetical protein